MELLERGAFLESLEGWLTAARNGEGSDLPSMQ